MSSAGTPGLFSMCSLVFNRLLLDYLHSNVRIPIKRKKYKDSSGLATELLLCHYCHILLVKALHKTSPDSKDVHREYFF